jgi:predicted TIM-barrel enzyme
VILTGKSTGDATDLNEVKLIAQNRGKLNMPIIIGSGVTKENVKDYAGIADAIVLGSYFKVDGYWENELDIGRVSSFMEYFNEQLVA